MQTLAMKIMIAIIGFIQNAINAGGLNTNETRIDNRNHFREATKLINPISVSGYLSDITIYNNKCVRFTLKYERVYSADWGVEMETKYIECGCKWPISRVILDKPHGELLVIGCINDSGIIIADEIKNKKDIQ